MNNPAGKTQSVPCHPVKRVLKEEGRTWFMVAVIVIAYLVVTGG